MAPDVWQPDVDVCSPDRCVRLRVSRAGQLQVVLRDLGGHSEESLARQVRAAARVALAALQSERSDDRDHGGSR